MLTKAREQLDLHGREIIPGQGVTHLIYRRDRQRVERYLKQTPLGGRSLRSRTTDGFRGTKVALFARSPRRLELVGGTGGLMIIGLGASIAVTGTKD